MRKKKALTLLEVMIALSLSAIVLTTLLSVYKEISLNQVKLERRKETVLNHKMVQQRLIRLFSAIRGKEGTKESPLYTSDFIESEGAALFIEFDNGLDLDPD